jgi:hypothetical protein
VRGDFILFLFCFFRAERPIGRGGLAEATLRVRAGDQNARAHLRAAFASLFRLYGHAFSFDVTVTANLVLQGNALPRYYLYYGQDFTAGVRRDLSVHAAPQVVSGLGDVETLRTDFDLEDFRDAFEDRFDDSDVTVSEIVNTVFIIRRFLPAVRHGGVVLTKLF